MANADIKKQLQILEQLEMLDSMDDEGTEIDQGSKEYGAGQIAGDLAKAAGRGVSATAKAPADIVEMLGSGVDTLRKAVLPKSMENLSVPMGPGLSLLSKSLGMGKENIERVEDEFLEYEVPRGELPALDAARTGTEFAASSLTPGAPLKVLRAAGAIGGAAAGGQELARRAGIGEEGQDTAALASSFAPTLPAALRSGLGLIRGRTPEQGALDAIQETTGQKPGELLRQSIGRKGTLAQATGNRDLASLEQTMLQRGERGFKERREALHDEIRTDLSDTLSGTQPPREQLKAPLQAARDRVKSVSKLPGAQEARARQRLEQRGAVDLERFDETAAAESEALRKLQGRTVEQWNIDRLNEINPTPDNLITEVGFKGDGNKGIAALDDRFKTAYGQAWKGVEEIPAESISEIRRQARLASDSMTDPQLIKRIDNMLMQAEDVYHIPNADKVRELDRSLGKSIRNASTGQVDYELKEGLEAMRGALRTGLPKETAERLRDIDSRYGSFLVARKAARKTDDGIATPEQYLSASREIGGNRFETGRAPMQQTALSSLHISPMQKTQTEGLASRQGEQRSQIVNQQTEQAKALRDQAAARQKGIKGSPLASYGKRQDPIESMRKVMGSEYYESDLRSVMNTARRAGPEAEDAARAAFRQNMKEFITKPDGGFITRKDSQWDRLNEQMNIVLPPAERERVRNAIEDTNKLFADLKVAPAKIPEPIRGAAYYTSYLLGPRIGAKLFGPGGALRGASTGARIAEKAFNKAPTDRMLENLESMMVNREYLAEAVARADKAKTSKDFNRLYRWLQGPSAQYMDEE